MNKKRQTIAEKREELRKLNKKINQRLLRVERLGEVAMMQNEYTNSIRLIGKKRLKENVKNLTTKEINAQLKLSRKLASYDLSQKTIKNYIRSANTINDELMKRFSKNELAQKYDVSFQDINDYLTFKKSKAYNELVEEFSNSEQILDIFFSTARSGGNINNLYSDFTKNNENASINDFLYFVESEKNKYKNEV